MPPSPITEFHSVLGYAVDREFDDVVRITSQRDRLQPQADRITQCYILQKMEYIEEWVCPKRV